MNQLLQPIETTTGPCRTCQQPTEQFAGSNITFNCDSCDAKLEEATKTDLERERDRKRAEHWAGICPSEFMTTDPNHPKIDKACVRIAQAYRYGGKGLGFVGKTGLGKTRALFLALKAMHDQGLSTYAVHHRDHAADAIVAAGGERDDMRRAEAKQRLELCRRTKVLLIDDLGKGRATPTAVEELEALIDFRTSNGRPILWTANSGSAWLVEKLGGDAGKAITRRLAEFSEIPNLER